MFKFGYILKNNSKKQKFLSYQEHIGLIFANNVFNED